MQNAVIVVAEKLVKSLVYHDISLLDDTLSLFGEL